MGEEADQIKEITGNFEDHDRFRPRPNFDCGRDSRHANCGDEISFVPPDAYCPLGCGTKEEDAGRLGSVTYELSGGSSCSTTRDIVSCVVPLRECRGC